MASDDLEDFVQERLKDYDPDVDLLPGSAADTKVVQPILRRLGTDPFTIELEPFLYTRLQQEYPNIALAEGDAIIDLAVKPMQLLMNPVVEEVKRVRNNLSFSDAITLTTTEAEALGANFFVTRETGSYARGRARLYFTTPQPLTVTPGNYLSTGGGLRYLPTSIQSITSDEMLLNKEGSYYYFDVTIVAAFPGRSYDQESGALVSVFGIPSAIRVTNKSTLQGGLDEEIPVEYVDRIEQELTERSLVTQPGILAAVQRSFPDVTQIAVVGFNDPEMERDVLRGGGVGPILASGEAGYAIPDGEGALYSRRFRISDPTINFTSLIGPIGFPVGGYRMTIIDAFGATATEKIRDLTIRSVVDVNAVEFEEQELVQAFPPSGALKWWMLRKDTVTLAGVEGGTELEGTNGEVVVDSNVVHIGGMTDIYIKGSATNSASLQVAAVTDDDPALRGLDAQFYDHPTNGKGFSLNDYTLGTDYSEDDTVYQALAVAKANGNTLQLFGTWGDEGSYRILDVVQAAGDAVHVAVDPEPTGAPGAYRWRLIDDMDISLLLPKETKLSGSDLLTAQGSTTVIVPSVEDLSAYGVGKDDWVEITTGRDVGTYQVTADTTNSQLVLDTALTASATGVSFVVYRRASEETLELPLVRIQSIDILDTTNQPVGESVPYAHPIDVRAFDFSVRSNFLKVDIRDGELGLISQEIPGTIALAGLTLDVYLVTLDTTYVVTFAGTLDVDGIINAINDALIQPLATRIGDRFGLVPYDARFEVRITGGTAFSTLFRLPSGLTELSTNHVRSETIESLPNKWDSSSYDLEFDSVEVVAQNVQGFANLPSSNSGLTLSCDQSFNPGIDALVRVGPRSTGFARAYFLDPTTVQVTPDATFTFTDDDGTELLFYPDPTVDAQIYPPLPTTDRATDGETNNVVPGVGDPYRQLISWTTNFLKKGVQVGDEVVCDFIPIVGDKGVPSPGPVSGLALTTFVVKVEGTVRTVVFANDDDGDMTAVTLNGILEQLNNVLGAGVATFDTSNYLKLECSYELEVIDGTGLGYFWLNFPGLGSVGNLSDNYYGGVRRIVAYVGEHELRFTSSAPDFLYFGGDQQFKIFRPGTQRVGTTQMALNQTYAGLYYADFLLTSKGSGSQYNLPAFTKLSVSGHDSLGYHLSTEETHLSFSLLEKPHLHVTPQIISVGASDDPENAVQIAGQNLQINYEWSSLADSLQSFVSSDSERVVNESALVRHLTPYFVRFDLTYRGPATDTVVSSEIDEYIDELSPDDSLQAVKIQQIPLQWGATGTNTPLNLVAVVHKEDRSLDAEQSSDYLNTGRLAAFISDVITVTRSVS